MRSPLQHQDLIDYLSDDLGIPYESLQVGIRGSSGLAMDKGLLSRGNGERNKR